MTLRAEQAPMVIGAVLLVLLGTFYVFEAHRLRDWSVRMMQRESYLTWVRVTGAIMVLAGIGMLYRDGARAPRYAIMAGRGPLKRRHAGTPFHLLPLDEAEVEGHLPREDQPPPVARACDRRAWQHPPRGHPDDLLPNAAAQDDAVASNFDAIKRHPVRPIDHDPSRSGSEGREGVVYATRCCARGSRARAYQGVAHTLRLLRWWVQGSTGFARALGHRPLPLRHPARDGRRRLERHVPTHEVVGPIAPGTGGA